MRTIHCEPSFSRILTLFALLILLPTLALQAFASEPKENCHFEVVEGRAGNLELIDTRLGRAIGWAFDLSEGRPFDEVLVASQPGCEVLARQQNLEPRLDVDRVTGASGTTTGFVVEFPGSFALFRDRVVEVYGLHHDSGSAKRIATHESLALFSPKKRIDHHARVYLAALLMLLMTYGVGGTLIASLLPEAKLKQDGFTWILLGSLPAAIGLYLLLFILFDAFPKYVLQVTPSNAVLAAAFLMLLAFATYRLRKRKGPVQAVARQDLRRSIYLLVTVLFALSFYLTKDLPRPMSEQFHSRTVNTKMFGGFNGHDHVFQHVNGMALAQDEPFSKYYGGGALVYEVYDREILPGVVYSVISRMLQVLWPEYPRYFWVYTVFGTCFNLYALVALLFLARLLFPGSPAIVIAVAAFASSFAVANLFFAWFKLSGAGFVLAGVYLLLRHPPTWRVGGAAGALFGVAANLHASSVLCLPFVVPFALWTHRPTLARAATSLLLQLSIVLAATLPWALVKKYFFVERYLLLRAYLFGAITPSTNSLPTIVVEFFQRFTWQEQLEKRMNQLLAVTRPEVWTEIGSAFSEGGFRTGVRLFNAYEFIYIGVLFAPLVVMQIVEILVRGRDFLKDFRTISVQFLLVAAAACLSLCFIAYPPEFGPDQSYAQPMATVLLVYFLALGRLIAANDWRKWMAYGFVGLQSVKLLYDGF